MANGRHLGKIKKMSYLGQGFTDFDQIWQVTQSDPLNRPTVKILKC